MHCHNQNVSYLRQIALQFIQKGAIVQVLVWRLTADKSEPKAMLTNELNTLIVKPIAERSVLLSICATE